MMVSKFGISFSRGVFSGAMLVSVRVVNPAKINPIMIPTLFPFQHKCRKARSSTMAQPPRACVEQSLNNISPNVLSSQLTIADEWGDMFENGVFLREKCLGVVPLPSSDKCRFLQESPTKKTRNHPGVDYH